MNLVPGALAPVFDHLQYAEVEREGRSHHVQYDVNSTQGRHVGNSAQPLQFTNFSLISLGTRLPQMYQTTGCTDASFQTFQSPFQERTSKFCWPLPLVCVYLSLHHIAALDAISARGSPTSSLQTTSDQNLDGGKGLGTRREEDH